MPNDLVGTYHPRDVAAARIDCDRLRRDCHEAFMVHGGDKVFLFVQRSHTPRERRGLLPVPRREEVLVWLDEEHLIPEEQVR